MVLDMLPKAAASVPKLSELRNMINYSEDRKPLGPSFWKHIQAFRELYTTTSNVPGSEFLKWKDSRHINGLIKMASSYLDDEGNGTKFWPEDSNAPEFNSLQYPINYKFIKSIIVQIFYRLNYQQYTNNRYKKKDKGKKPIYNESSRRPPTTARSSSSPRVGGSRPQRASRPEADASSSTEPYFRALSPDRGMSGLIDPSLQSHRSGNSEADPFMVPDSPKSTPQDTHHQNPRPATQANRHQGQSSFQVHLDTATKSTSNRPDAEAGRPAKRPRLNSGRHKAKSRAPRLPKRGSAPGLRNPPRSTRGDPVYNPESAYPKELQEACRTPVSTASESTDAALDVENSQQRKATHQEAASSENNTIPASARTQGQPHMPQTQEMEEVADATTQNPVEEGLDLLRRITTGSNGGRDRSPLPSIPEAPTDSSRASPSTMVNETPLGANSTVAQGATDLTPLAIHSAAGPASENQPTRSGQHIEHNEGLPGNFIRAQTAPPPAQPSPAQHRAPMAFMGASPVPVDVNMARIPEQAASSDSHQSSEPKDLGSENQRQGRQDEAAKQHDQPAQDHAEINPPPVEIGEPHDCEARAHEPERTEPGNEIAEDPKQNGTDHIHAQQKLPLKEPSPRGTAEVANVHFSFVIVLAREPRWRAIEWFPKGRFLQKTLPQFKEELPAGFADDALGLMIRLIGPDWSNEQPIVHGENVTFGSMTKNFARKIQKAISKHTGEGPLSFRIEIEELQDDWLDGKDDDEILSLC